jgi:hypothetical protein
LPCGLVVREHCARLGSMGSGGIEIVDFDVEVHHHLLILTLA